MWQIDHNRVSFLGKPAGFVRRQQAYLTHLSGKARQTYAGRHRNIFHKSKQVVALRGYAAPGEWLVERVGVRTVNGFGIHFYPFTDTEQHIALKLHYRSVTSGADIEQVIPATTDHLYQAGDLLFHFRLNLSPLLPRAVAPRFGEDGGGGLPRHAELIIGIFVIGHHGKIHPIVAQPSADHTLRLQAADQLVQSLALRKRE